MKASAFRARRQWTMLTSREKTPSIRNMLFRVLRDLNMGISRNREWEKDVCLQYCLTLKHVPN